MNIPRKVSFRKVLALLLLMELTTLLLVFPTIQVLSNPSYTVTPVGFDAYPSSVSYVVETDGAGNYRAIGHDGFLLTESTDASSVIASALEAGTGKVFCRQATYSLSTLITIDNNDTLEWEAGCRITPSSDIDLIYVKEDGVLVGGLYDVIGLSYSSSVIKLESDRYWHYETGQQTTVKNVRGLGDGTGTFLHLHGTSSNNYVAWCTFENVYADSFQYGIHLLSADSTGWIHSNNFESIFMSSCQYAINLEQTGTGTVQHNHFLDFHYQAEDALTEQVITVEGQGNLFTGEIWDLNSTDTDLGLAFTNASALNKFEGLIMQGRVSDLGFLNEIESTSTYNQFPYSRTKFYDDFTRPILGDGTLWKVESGTWTIATYGEAQGITGNTAYATACIDMNSVKMCTVAMNPSFLVKFDLNKTTSYSCMVALRQDANNLIYFNFTAGWGTFGCTNGGASTTGTNFTLSPTQSITTLIITDGTSVSFWTWFANTLTCRGTITTNVPSGPGDDYFDLYINAMSHNTTPLQIKVWCVQLVCDQPTG